MCGIVAIAGKEDVAGRLVDGLKRLEYRGYDSAGVAVAAAGDQDRIALPVSGGSILFLTRCRIFLISMATA